VAPPAEEAKPPAAEEAKPPAAPEAKPPPPADEGQAPIGDEEKRDVPDYEGRGGEPVTAGDVLIWVPRVVFFPIYLVTEYVIRWPLGKLTELVEREEVPKTVANFFTFDAEGKTGLIPSALIDFGFRPSIGLYFFTDDLFVKNHGIRSHAAFGGIDWYRFTLTNRYHFSRESPVSYESFAQLRGVYSHRPDWKFYGLGPLSRDEDFARYGAQHIEGTLSYETGYWRSGRIHTWVGVRDTLFKPELGCCDDPTLADRIADGVYPAPPLLDDGYTILRAGFEGSVDTRRRRTVYAGEASDFVEPSGTGLRLALRGQVAGGLRTSPPPTPDPEAPDHLRYVRYGATFGTFLDLYRQRVLGLSFIVDFADPIVEGGQIPFTELVSFGGDRPMRGFLEHRLLDRSGAAARLEYRWPIWVYLDGTLQYELGNVFGTHLEGFNFELLRQSFNFGLSAVGARDHSFELLFGFGTTPFDEGGEVESFRFVFGTTSGF
jgi:hypothetical protein